VPETQENNPTLERLNDQIAWYGAASGRNRRWYKCLKGLTIVAAVLIAPISPYPWGSIIAGALGIAIAIAEGLQHLNNYHENWLSYRTVAEALKSEKYLYLAQAGAYASVERPLAVLAERIESLTSAENAKWLTTQEQKAARAATQQP